MKPIHVHLGFAESILKQERTSPTYRGVISMVDVPLETANSNNKKQSLTNGGVVNDYIPSVHTLLRFYPCLAQDDFEHDFLVDGFCRSIAKHTGQTGPSSQGQGEKNQQQKCFKPPPLKHSLSGGKTYLANG